MADEAQLHISLMIQNVTNSELEYQSRPTSITADVGSGAWGPTPGIVSATTAGVEVDLTEITAMGGLCFLHNLDPTNYVTYGVLDSDGSTFHELGELLAGEFTVLRLSRNIGDGSGTDYESLFLKANTATCRVRVEAFDK